MRVLARRALRKLLGESGYESFLGLYWSVKLRISCYEPETLALPYLIPSGGVCLDIGGNFGQFACFLSRAVGPGGQVHSFEPLPCNQRIFAQVMRRLGCSNVVLHACAAGEANGVGTLRAAEFHTAEAHLTKSHHGLEVPIVRLDDWAERLGLGVVHFVKVDVEGYELFVFEGAQRILAACHPVILCEAGDKSEDRFRIPAGEIFRFLSRFGYASYIWKRARLIPTAGLRGDHFNYFFVHSTGEPSLRHLIAA